MPSWMPWSRPDAKVVPDRDGVSPFLNVLAPMALEFGPRSVRWDDLWTRVYGVLRYPPQVGAAWLARLANHDGVYLSLQAEPTDPTQLALALTRAITQMTGQLQGGSLNPLLRQRLLQQVTDADTLLKKIDAEQQSLFLTGVFLLVTAPDAVTGRQRCQRLEGLAAAQGLRLRPLVYRQHEGLLSMGPWGQWHPDLKGSAPFQLPAETLAAAFPFSYGGINHGSGILLGRDDHRGLVLINRWDPPAEEAITNKNMALLGPSGGGKTWTASLMILREWMLGAKVIVIDPMKRDYRGLCQAVGGAWINAAGGEMKINPFQAPVDAGGPSEADDAVPGSLAPMMLQLQRVQTFLETYLPELTALQQALLAQAVQELYQTHGITMETRPGEIPADQWPHMGHLYQGVSEHAAADPLSADWAMLMALLRDAGAGIACDRQVASLASESLVPASFLVQVG